MAAAFTAAATATRRRRQRLVVVIVRAVTAVRGEQRELAAHFLAVALCANYVIGVLVSHDQFKAGFAILAIIFVQGHRKRPPDSSNDTRFLCSRLL